MTERPLPRGGSRVAIMSGLAIVSVAGVIGLISMVVAGPEPRWRWGYVAATLSFLLSAVQLAPVLSAASRLGRGYWGARLRRMADLFALCGIVTAPVLIVLMRQLPEWRGRPSIWFDWPAAPGVWDTAAAIGLALAGAGLVAITTWPEHRTRGWLGTPTQWRVLTRGTIALGVVYTLLAVFVHLIVVSDLAVSLVPGWHSAVAPPYHVESGFEAAVALVVVALAAARALDRRISRTCAKLLLALALLWFYFVWCELLTDWYGATPDERGALGLFMFGPGAGLFLAASVCELVIPMAVLIWNRARSSPRVVTLVAAIVVAGNLVDRVRLYVGAWTVATPTASDHLPDVLPSLPLPGLAEIAATLGPIALSGLLIALVLRRISPVSHWEVKAIERLTPEVQALRTRVTVVARPS